MKQILISLFLIGFLCTVSSCRKEEPITPSQPSTTTIINQGGVQMKTHYYTVTPDKWVSNNDLDYLYAAYEDVDINASVIENGCVIAYFVDADGRDNPMPYEIYCSYEENGNILYYSDTFTYDVEQGIITFKFEASDFDNASSIAKYGNMQFKVCVLDPAAAKALKLKANN